MKDKPAGGKSAKKWKPGTPEDQLWGPAKKQPVAPRKPPGRNFKPGLQVAAADGVKGSGKARVVKGRSGAAKAIDRALGGVQGKPGSKKRVASRTQTRGK